MARDQDQDGDRERGEGGEFVTEVTLDDVLAAFEQVDAPVIFTSDVIDELDISRESARQKLTRLFDQGRIARRKKGRTIVWWRTDDDTTEESAERRLQQLSQELDQPIAVGDRVYEDGDMHRLADSDEEVERDE